MKANYVSSLNREEGSNPFTVVEVEVTQLNLDTGRDGLDSDNFAA